MGDFKDKIRDRLADLGEDEFDGLADLVDTDLESVAGGFQSFGSFTQFGQGPSFPPSPGDPGGGGGGPGDGGI